MENREKTDVLCWIERSLEDKQFAHQEIVFAENNKKTGGYTGDIIFATVKGVYKDGYNEEVNLVIKIGKQNETLRKQLPMLSECYRREILVYDQVLPAFKKFQAEKNVIDCFDAVPKCYRTFLSEFSEALVLEDLTKHGYIIRDKSTPMNSQHVELVLSNYAKFHALSLALRDQRTEEYNTLTSNYYPHNIRMLSQLSELFHITETNVVHHLRAALREDLVEQFGKDVRIGIENTLLDILRENVEHSVILHGSCYNNNFMFQYEENDTKTPTKMSILDWQVSIQHSPVIDLSGFLYSVGGEHVHRLPELLEFYHATLANYLKDLGTDVEKVFSFDTLLKDWKRYSFYGFALFITFLLFESNVAPSGMDQIFENKKLEDCEEYRKRLIRAVNQYCNRKL